MFVDSSSSLVGLGTGLILVSPDGSIDEYALYFEFPTMNNEAKYKTLAIDLKY